MRYLARQGGLGALSPAGRSVAHCMKAGGALCRNRRRFHFGDLTDTVTLTNPVGGLP